MIFMTTHYATSHRFGKAFVSVDNRTATKVSVWYADEETPRKRFVGHEAFDDAMNFALDLSDDEDFSAPTNESVAIALGGIPADDDSDY